MDMLFTHFGISGPAALRCSQFVYKEQKNQKTRYSNATGCLSWTYQNELEQKIRRLLEETPDKFVKNSLHGLIEERYLLFLIEQAHISDDLTAHHIANAQINQLVELLKGFTFTVNGTLSIEKPSLQEVVFH